MIIQNNDNKLIITIEKGPDNVLYKWLQFNAKKKLEEAMQKSIQFNQLADSLKMIVGTPDILTSGQSMQKINAIGEELPEEKKQLTAEEILSKLKMF